MAYSHAKLHSAGTATRMRNGGALTTSCWSQRSESRRRCRLRKLPLVNFRYKASSHRGRCVLPPIRRSALRIFAHHCASLRIIIADTDGANLYTHASPHQAETNAVVTCPLATIKMCRVIHGGVLRPYFRSDTRIYPKSVQNAATPLVMQS